MLALLLLGGCKDVLNKPLGSVDKPANPGSIEGRWVAGASTETLEIRGTNKEDWYKFKWQQQGKVTEGRFVIAYFRFKQVFNIDLASVTVNGKPVVDPSQTAFVLLGAYLDDNELQLVPANMDKFEQYFSKYFYASPIAVGSLCADKNAECSATFTSGNALISKRMRKFNDEFVKKYRSVFPRKQQVIFIRQ